MWGMIYEKLGDILVALSLAGVFGIARKGIALGSKLKDLEVDLIRNYATQKDLAEINARIAAHAADDREVHRNLEDKLDRVGEGLNNKVDTVINILLTKTK